MALAAAGGRSAKKRTEMSGKVGVDGGGVHHGGVLFPADRLALDHLDPLGRRHAGPGVHPRVRRGRRNAARRRPWR